MMESNSEGNLLEIIDLARTLRQEQLFIQQEQNAFTQLNETLADNSTSLTKLAYICAQQRQNLNDLIISRPNTSAAKCCLRAKNYDNIKFIEAHKVLEYEHALAYEELFNYLYRSPYLLAVSLSNGDRLNEITPQHLNSVIHTITTGLYGNVINIKDVELMLKLLRELVEIQIVVSDNPRNLLRANASSFARLYHRLNESMFSAKIFLTAALYEPIMGVLSANDISLDIDPNKVIQSFSSKEKLKRFGLETANDYKENVAKFHSEIISKLHDLATNFIESLTNNWSLFPSTLRWLVQTMCHQLKQAHFSDKIINEVITDMVFTHFICPAIVSPDIMGIIDAPISEHLRFNLIQIGQIIQMLALAQYEDDIDNKFAELYAKFETNNVTLLIDILLTSQTGDDVVAILSQQSNFERTHLLSTQAECSYFIEFFRILMGNDLYDINQEDRDKLQKILNHLPENLTNGITESSNPSSDKINSNDNNRTKDSTAAAVRSKQSFMSLGKSTKNKIAKTMSFHSQGSNLMENNNNNNNSSSNNNNITANVNGLLNGTQSLAQAVLAAVEPSTNNGNNSNSSHSSPKRTLVFSDSNENDPVLIFNLFNSEENKLQPLTEEEVLKMNSIGQEIQNGEALLVDTAESCNLDNTIDKSSVVNGFDNIDGTSDVILPLHAKTTRFSISHDDASIGNSDNLEAVSEAPSNHSVTSSLELEENDQNDNLSDMVSANVSGRGTPNISGRDTPSSQVTDGESVHNALTTPQIQKLISKARSDIEDKFCKFEIKKFERDETVSIISDTWSTDVLASDSETLDAGERTRDTLTGRRVSGGRSTRRSDGYFDASDQRSESNWSTEVLASDSEKLNDTDDNASITVKLDMIDRDEHNFESNRRLRPNVGNFPNRNSTLVTNNRIVATGGSGEGTGRGDDDRSSVDSCTGSERSQEDSTFFDAINSYEDRAAADVGPDVADLNGPDEPSSSSNHRKYQPMSSLARSSARTTNQLTGENSFQQNYKSSSNDPRKDPFLNASRMQRQVSADSSISNQSFGMDDIIRKSSRNNDLNAIKKKHQQQNPNFKLNDSKDLIDFSDFGEERQKVSNRSSNSLLLAIGGNSNDELGVERRRVSLTQRTAGFDGRRNGIMAMKKEDNPNGNRLVPSLRRHQSLNYENHEIVLNVTIPNGNDNENGPAIEVPQTDDDKQELLICAKTEEMHLESSEPDNNPFFNVYDSSVEASTSNTLTQGTADKTQSSDVNKQNRPTKATGAIPKSISFDASADKQTLPSSLLTVRPTSSHSPRPSESLRYHLNGSTNTNSGLFNKIKKGIFKPKRNNKANRHTLASITNDEFPSSTNRNVSFDANASEVSFEVSSDVHLAGRNSLDITEDILAKYRRKVSTSSEATNSDSIGCNSHHLQIANRKSLEIERRSPNSILHDKAIAFNIIKKKIRTVLSKTDLHASDFRHNTFSNAAPLLTYLRIQLAQALNLQNLQQLSYVSEAIRCISLLERSQHTQLLDELQNDIQKRQNYLQYLMRYRQNLILIMENIEQFEKRLRSESNTCNRNLLNVCVRLFLEKRESKIETFQEEFAHLNVSDDKIVLIEEFIEKLMNELISNGGILYNMPEWQIEEARISIERILLQRMYQQVMFPNEDADLSRDSVLSDHIRKLQNVIRPSHPALCIPQEYLSEAPWLLAQQQLSYISAYKTPKEKLQCVIRCIASIISLLRISSGRVPSADDILPVLIFVVIMTNPPYLLSTVEYISCFIGDKLDGEEEFNWTLFGSVVKFIKTMDYLD